jgi:hypothetical protein
MKITHSQAYSMGAMDLPKFDAVLPQKMDHDQQNQSARK